MKLSEGIKLKGKGRIEIPDCGRDDLPQFFVDLGYKTGVEIGVYKGEYTKKFCEVGLKMHAVDPWKQYKDYQPKRSNYKERQDFLYEHTKRYLSSYDCEIVRKTSMDAVKDFEDESLDFIYIDGHHGLKYVIEDIYEWSWKVKKGGMISGHDYGLTTNNPESPFVLQVKYAVDTYIKAFKIKKWYVLGRKEKREGEVRDEKFRSWMWFKE